MVECADNAPGVGVSLRIGLVSTYAPTKCGLAFFTSALREALTSSGIDTLVVRVVPAGGSGHVSGAVAAELVHGDAKSRELAGRALTTCDVVVVQFEFGIFGGQDGAEAIDLISGLRVPSIVVLHTVLSAPSAGQRQVLEQVVAAVNVVVVMSEVARDRLRQHYDLGCVDIVVIPHGAELAAYASQPRACVRPLTAQPTILTWGLIGPGKGIEWGIDALPHITGVPRFVYVVAGQTHPNVLARDGEEYRLRLARRAANLGVADRVVFDANFRDGPEALATLVSSADVVLLPYDFPEQVSSGVLVEAVAAGVPVVATRFAHAVELLGQDGGLIVDPRDAHGIAAALTRVLTSPGLGASMRRANLRHARELAWPTVAARYSAVAAGLATCRRTA